VYEKFNHKNWNERDCWNYHFDRVELGLQTVLVNFSPDFDFESNERKRYFYQNYSVSSDGYIRGIRSISYKTSYQNDQRKKLYKR